ncbi:oligosaccharide flippase family protein [Arenibacter sp. GZD96]|uniref:lipopolysaccharide biosynthesis protein n=1 Tax=Aurantibrevibacter litoralis TaxID=3106030 RepID=UPI002AFDED2F|nr:oligosaccharide flippase family protein [Arenibacter sp. GZD-96]MEA1787468.1 oligosaccharide flippase family protein [Arenibacter sp. GZD-96]
MGIIFKQSFRNTIITYLGFGVGAINTLFLYTRFLTPEYYGLVNVILSVSAVLMPLLAFGVPNTIVKYYSGYSRTDDAHGFLTLMLILPLFLIVPIAVLSYGSHEAIANFLSRENSIVKGYVWHIFFIGVAMAYFEVFYAWTRIQMKSVFGNFLKEVFCRVGVTLFLGLLYFDFFSVNTFLTLLVLLYVLRALVMLSYAFYLKPPRLRFRFPPNTASVLKYSTLIILGGSAAIVLLEIDKVMINQFIKIDNVAFYSVAVFIATVIAVPSRAMHQITYPLTAELINKGNATELKQLYQRSSLTLFIVSGLLFVLIILNLEDLYRLLPEAYRGGFTVVFLIGISRVYDALLGNSNALLYNSDYYTALLWMGVLLAVSTILFNLWLIPAYGLNGAAYASFAAFFIYNTLKLGFVQWKFNMLPFTLETLKILMLLFSITGGFYLVSFALHPITNILIKSSLVVVCFVWVLYKFKISQDIYARLHHYLKRKTPKE